MQGGFYDDVFSKYNIKAFIPDDVDLCYIHDKYLAELIKGIVRDETKSELLAIAEKMRLEHAAQGLILGGTELPLILVSTQELFSCALRKLLWRRILVRSQLLPKGT